MTKLARLSRRQAWIVLVAIYLGACSTGTVVLLPEKNGRDTAVVVRQGDKEVLLNQPYAAAKQTPSGPQPYASTPQEVESVFGAALAAQPMRPTQFTLYFIEGKDEFTDESKQIVDSIFSEIAKRPVPDVQVFGHTDSVGNDQYNDVLAQQRADTVRAALIRRGIASENIVAMSRGKREPVIPTAEGVAEPRNRRVEIIVR